MNFKSIQVLGSGCPTCKQLFENVKKITKKFNITTEVEYISDISKIIEMGIMTSPVLAINGKAVLSGTGISENDIEKALNK